MKMTMELEVTVQSADVATEIEELIRRKVGELHGSEICSIEVLKMKGLGVAEAAVLFVIAVSGQLVATELQRRIDRARLEEHQGVRKLLLSGPVQEKEVPTEER